MRGCLFTFKSMTPAIDIGQQDFDVFVAPDTLRGVFAFVDLVPTRVFVDPGRP